MVNRIPNAPPQYTRQQLQQILTIVQQALDDLDRRAGFRETQTTVGSAGTAAALPANPTGYVEAVVGGKTVVIPYYDAE